MTLVRLEPAAPLSLVKHSSTEPLRSLKGVAQIHMLGRLSKAGKHLLKRYCLIAIKAIELMLSVSNK